ncbi:hypothetical protein L2E82_48835 [Cichorium intybus]|uniref:Uncharacterized protein n=1 Tax=Cichorium intybus TaxID=13427 RepID=A0ACB8Z315_CICIN|nr:hypothetical protein L2E82_48835 [Cichorium intybus]
MDDSATSVPSSIWDSLNSWFTSTVLFVLLNVMIATIVFTSNLPNNNQQNHHQQEQEEEQKQNSQTHHNHQNDRNQPQIARSPSILHRLKSFNFLPPRSQLEFSPENDDHQEPLQLAATQYVFNQHLDYQHFDYDFNSTGSDHTTAAAAAEFSAPNHIHEAPPPYTETHAVWEHQQSVETGTTHFDLDPTREEIQSDTGFEDAHEEEHTDEFQSLDEVYSKLKSGHDRTKSESDLPPKPQAKMKKSASLKVGFAHIEEEEIVEARRPVTVRDRKSAARVMEEDDVEVDSKADDFINKFKNDLKLQRIESIIRTKGATGRGTAK